MFSFLCDDDKDFSHLIKLKGNEKSSMVVFHRILAGNVEIFYMKAAVELDNANFVMGKIWFP